MYSKQAEFTSRKIEGESRIIRPPKEQHMQTLYLPYQKTIQAVPYYSRRKRQLQSRYKSMVPEEEQEHGSLRPSISREGGQAQSKTHKGYNGAITEISVEPVINDNKFTNFDPELYPLEEHEKVKVVEERYFPLQNYYNYIWAVKSSEEIFKLAQQTQKQAKEALQKKNMKYSRYLNEGDYDQYHKKGPIKKEVMKIKGSHQSRFNQSSGYRSRKSQQGLNNELSPIHINFQQGHRNSTPFIVKQYERQSIVRASVPTQIKNKY